MEGMPLKRIIDFKATNLALVEKRMDKILTKIRLHIGTEPVGDAFDKLVTDIYSCFPVDTLRYDVVYASLMPHAGKLLDREALRMIAWRMAGNYIRLKKGQPVPPWTKQTELEWCPIAIVKSDPGWGFDGTQGYFYEYRVMAGTPAGRKFTLFWSRKYIRYIARSMGFKRTRKGYFKVSNGQQLTRMKLYLLFDPELSKDERPVAFHFYVPSSMVQQNQDIIEQRFRVQPCPLKYSLVQLACHDCPVGYDECKAGCHPKTYYRQGCPRCGEEKWFDPIGRGVVCIECEEQARSQSNDRKDG